MSLKKFQTKIGVKPDGDFGRITLLAAKRYLDLSNEQAAHFFGQCAHESGNFTVFSENLNYSSAGLIKTFRRYFPNISFANQYERKPIAIANRVYANRMGNGTEFSGDGWKYRGRGAIQLTGKSNYISFAQYVKFPQIVETPDLVETDYCFESAKFFFDREKLWDIAETVSLGSIRAISKRVNGGFKGLDDRIEKTNKFYDMLKRGA